MRFILGRIMKSITPCIADNTIHATTANTRGHPKKIAIATNTGAMPSA